jgi:hypothetical protein
MWGSSVKQVYSSLAISRQQQLNYFNISSVKYFHNYDDEALCLTTGSFPKSYLKENLNHRRV